MLGSYSFYSTHFLSVHWASIINRDLLTGRIWIKYAFSRDEQSSKNSGASRIQYNVQYLRSMFMSRALAHYSTFSRDHPLHLPEQCQEDLSTIAKHWDFGAYSQTLASTFLGFRRGGQSRCLVGFHFLLLKKKDDISKKRYSDVYIAYRVEGVVCDTVCSTFFAVFRRIHRIPLS